MSKPVDRIQTLRWLAYVIVSASLVVSMLIVAWLWGPHLIFTTTPITKTFAKYQQFAPICRAVVGVAPETESLEELKSRFSSAHPDFKSIQIPTRLTTTKFSGDVNEFMVIRCVGSLKLKGDAHHGWMHIGYVEGWSKIWINDHLKLEVFPNKPDVNFSIDKDDTGDNAAFTVVSRRTTQVDLGLSSAVPLMYGTDFLELEAIKNLYHYGGREIPLARVSFCAGLLLILGISWLFGLRYLDLSWMIVMIMSLIIQYSWPIISQYFHPSSDWPLRVLFQLAGLGAMVGFIMSFLRDFSLTRRILITYFTVFVSLVIIFVIGEKYFGSQKDVYLMASYISWAVVLGFGAWRSLTLVKSLPVNLPRRSRIKIFGIISAAGSVTYLLQTWMMTFVPIFFADYIALTVVALFTGFLCVDLVLYQQGFFTEKVNRELAEQKRLRLAEALSIGQTAQELLLPMHVTRSHHKIKLEYHCAPHITMAGDWMDSWEGPNGSVIVLLGDVSGKGPAAAIAMASIMTMMRGFHGRNSGLKSAISEMSPQLFSLFNGSIITTWAGVEIQPNGEAWFAGGGSPGWFIVDEPHQVTTVPCRNAMLGLGKDPVEFELQAIKLSSSAKVISISDGICDGSRHLRKFSNLLAGLSGKETTAIIHEILAFADTQKIEDDRSLIVIERLSPGEN